MDETLARAKCPLCSDRRPVALGSIHKSNIKTYKYVTYSVEKWSNA